MNESEAAEKIQAMMRGKLARKVSAPVFNAADSRPDRSSAHIFCIAWGNWQAAWQDGCFGTYSLTCMHDVP